MRKIALSIFSFALFTLIGVSHVEAQWSGSRMTREEWAAWRAERSQEDDESEDVDMEAVERWRSESSRRNSAINDLDDDEVEEFAIPVLFGVVVSDLTKNFGDPRGGGTREHEGLDILAAEGTPIVTPTEAVVIRVGSGSSSGKYVTTANPGGETFVYMHLSDHADIDEGDKLDVGDVIGYVGDTGNAAGGPAHLHFEVRKSRTALDPFPRLTESFSLEDQMEYLEEIMKDVGDEDEFAEFLVDTYLGVFVQAKAADIDIPDEVEDALPNDIANLPGGVPAVDLTIGSTGTNVMLLQSMLITQGYLAISAPTGTFGPLTQTALINYQKAHGITPATGYYGPTTRAYLASGAGTLTEAQLRKQLIAKIAELTEILEKLMKNR